MSDDRTRLIRLIHVARRALSLKEYAYRTLLQGTVGLDSCRDCSLQELRQILAVMEQMGFRPKLRRTPVKSSQRGHLCTEAQRTYIEGLWHLASREKTEKSLRAIIRRIAHVDDMRFLTKPQASRVILCLRDIADKAGFDPDRGPVRE